MSAPAESMSREEGFAHREEGSRRCFGMGSWCSRLGSRPPVQKEAKPPHRATVAEHLFAAGVPLSSAPPDATGRS